MIKHIQLQNNKLPVSFDTMAIAIFAESIKVPLSEIMNSFADMSELKLFRLFYSAVESGCSATNQTNPYETINAFLVDLSKDAKASESFAEIMAKDMMPEDTETDDTKKKEKA